MNWKGIHDSRPDPDANSATVQPALECSFYSATLSDRCEYCPEFCRFGCCVDSWRHELVMAATMSRRPRIQFAGRMYHVMARGNRKSTIFQDDEDRRRFIEVLDTAAALYDLLVRAVCLMGNHYHFVLETPEPNLSDAMQYINGVFAQRSNRRHRQTGHVFEGRFRSLIIQRDSYLMRAARYVVRNPVRASLVDGCSAWPWSSYRATAGLEPVPRWLHVDWIKGPSRRGQWRSTTTIRRVRQRACIIEVRPNLNAGVRDEAVQKGSDAMMSGATGPIGKCPGLSGHCHRPSLSELFEGWRKRLKLAIESFIVPVPNTAIASQRSRGFWGSIEARPAKPQSGGVRP